MEYDVNDFNLEQVKLEAKLNLANEELRRVLEAKDIINKATMDTIVKLSSENYNEKIMKKIIIDNNNAIQQASGCMGIKNDYNLSTETNNLAYEVNLSIEGLGDFFKSIWDFIINIIKAIWNAITGFFKAIYNFFFGTKKSVGSSVSSNSSATPVNTEKVNNMINNIANGNNVNATPKDLAALPKVEEKLKDFLEKNNKKNRIFVSLIMENGILDIEKYFLDQCNQYSKYIDVLQKKITVINSFCNKFITEFSSGQGINGHTLFDEFREECNKMLEGYDNIDFGFTDLVNKSKINRFNFSTNSVGYKDFIKKNSITYIKDIVNDKITYININKIKEVSSPFVSRQSPYANIINSIKIPSFTSQIFNELDSRDHDYSYITTSDEIELIADDSSDYDNFIKKHCDEKDKINIVDLKHYKNAEIMMDKLANKVKEVTKKISDIKDYTVKGIDNINMWQKKNDDALLNLVAGVNYNNLAKKTEHLYFLILFSELLSSMYLKYVGTGVKKREKKLNFDNSDVSLGKMSNSGCLVDMSKSFVNFSSKMNKFITDYIGFATDVYKIVDGKDLPTRATQQQTQTVQSQVQQTKP